MPRVKLVREPGYIYDLFYIFSLNFNLDKHLSKDVNPKKVKEDTKFYTETLKSFEPISEDTHIFFHLKKNGRSFMTTYYFKAYKSVFGSEYNFQFLINELADHERLIRQLFEFYFSGTDRQVIFGAANPILEVSKLIDTSDYEEIVKRKLYSFFINPEQAIQKLVYELMSKEVALNKYYESHYKAILDMPNLLDFNKLRDDLAYYRDLDYLRGEDNDINMTVCLVNKNCVNLLLSSEVVTFILGNDYRVSSKDFADSSIAPSLQGLGEIFTEQNRMDMLDLLLKHGEMTIKELEQQLNLTGSTAYYHLTMMTRQKMLSTRNQGRTILYSLNHGYFESVIRILSKYTVKRGD